MLLCVCSLAATQGLSCNEELMQLYLLVSSNVEGWLDVSVSVCSWVACGSLMQNINRLLYFISIPHGGSDVRKVF